MSGTRYLVHRQTHSSRGLETPGMLCRLARTASIALPVASMLPVLPAWSQSDIRMAVVADAQKTPEVSTVELRGLLAGREATLLDARPYMEFATGHIPGALNVAAKPGTPMSLYVSDVAEVVRLLEGNKNSALILYCNGP